MARACRRPDVCRDLRHENAPTGGLHAAHFVLLKRLVAFEGSFAERYVATHNYTLFSDSTRKNSNYLLQIVSGFRSIGCARRRAGGKSCKSVG
jgi:hypothetical protein